MVGILQLSMQDQSSVKASQAVFHIKSGKPILLGPGFEHGGIAVLKCERVFQPQNWCVQYCIK